MGLLQSFAAIRSSVVPLVGEAFGLEDVMECKISMDSDSGGILMCPKGGTRMVETWTVTMQN